MKKVLSISLILLLLLPIIALGQEIGESCLVKTKTLGVAIPPMFSDMIKIMKLPEAEAAKQIKARVDSGDFFYVPVGTKIITIEDIALIGDDMEKCVLAKIEGVKNSYWLMAEHLVCTKSKGWNKF